MHAKNVEEPEKKRYAQGMIIGRGFSIQLGWPALVAPPQSSAICLGTHANGVRVLVANSVGGRLEQIVGLTLTRGIGTNCRVDADAWDWNKL
jgi:hypothetical protein